ncbi:MAG TPA: DUF1573 domain-containing protein [Sedimentisphaerales bacterium]|nr:DUF1573 domain-containing protein [Sedimentisphaerales bacterium]
MKRNWLLITLVANCIVLLHNGCQEQERAAEKPKTGLTESKPAIVSKARTVEATTEAEPNKPGPRITFEKVTHDFGDVGPGTQHTCEFGFTNTGVASLKISEIQTCCGIKAELKNDKQEYRPGESGAVVLTYIVRGAPGPVKKRIFAASNDTVQPSVQLTITGTIAIKVRHEPDKLALLLKGEDGGCPEITLTSVDGEPFSIKSFEAPGNCMTAAFDSSVKDTKLVLAPKVDMGQLKSNLRGYVRIGLTHPKCDTVLVPFEVLRRFDVTPNSILLREAEAEKPVRRELWVLNNYGEQFEIGSVSSKNGAVKVLSQQKVDNRYKFELEITPPPAGGKTFFSDIFSVNIKDGEELKINCRGFYPRTRRR